MVLCLLEKDCDYYWVLVDIINVVLLYFDFDDLIVDVVCEIYYFFGLVLVSMVLGDY